jgi:hypothetical protein
MIHPGCSSPSHNSTPQTCVHPTDNGAIVAPKLKVIENADATGDRAYRKQKSVSERVTVSTVRPVLGQSQARDLLVRFVVGATYGASVRATRPLEFIRGPMLTF